jgi:transposase
MLFLARNCCTTSNVWLGALSHTSLVVQQFLAEKSIAVITQPPYYPDLAPSDFWLFPTLKVGLKGAHFATTEDNGRNKTAELQKIPKEDFRRCFQQWQDRRSKSVCAQGSYFESD